MQRYTGTLFFFFFNKGKSKGQRPHDSSKIWPEILQYSSCQEAESVSLPPFEFGGFGTASPMKYRGDSLPQWHVVGVTPQ